MNKTLLLSVFALLPLVSSALPAFASSEDSVRTAASGPDNWPQFRGADSRGVADSSDLPDTWSTEQNIAWKVDVPGLSWSSPVVWGNRVFLTTAINEGENDEPRKGLYGGGERSKPLETKHRWVVYCFDFETGKILWQRVAHEGKPEHPIHIKNTYASETPVTDGESVYAYFGNIGLFAYDMDGNPLWDRRWKTVPMAMNWGTAASPALHDGRLYIVNDNTEKSFLEALDAKTGRSMWRVERDEKSNWSTPFVWENEKRTEIVTPGSGKVRSYDLKGKLLWELQGMSGITIATPYAAHGLLYVTSGFVMSRNKPIYAIKPGAAGDISLAKGETANAHIAWCGQGAPYNPSTVVYGDLIYSLFDMGTFACFDARTGAEVYGKQRLGRGMSFTTSPWAYGDKVFCLNEDGDTFVIQAGPEFKVLHKNSLGEMCMATPAIARDSLFIRTMSKLYRIAERDSMGR